MLLLEQFVAPGTAEYEMCRMQVTNSTTKQLRHHLASFCSDLYIISNNMAPVYEDYVSNAGCTWSLIGKLTLRRLKELIIIFCR